MIKPRMIYTEKMIENARYNVTHFPWGKDLLKATLKAADKYIDVVETLYNLIPGEGIPRSYKNCTLPSPDSIKCHCPKCGEDIDKKYGNYNFNAILEPWKIICPHCNAKFPTNDFALLYERGLDEKGVYHRELAYKNNRDAVARGEKDALVNELYPEMGLTWMVDDGFGWSPSAGTYGTKDMIQFAPVAKYTHLFWYDDAARPNSICKILTYFRDAYLFTGELKYGRAGAVLLDRVADVYPDYDIKKINLNYHHSHGGGFSGKIVGSIQEYYVTEIFIRCFDAFKPMFEDEQVIAFLSEKAKKLHLDNPKTSGNFIYQNMEKGIPLAIIEGLYNASVYGNFGLHQKIAALTAVALDRQPESSNLLRWIAAPSANEYKKVVDPIFGEEYKCRCKNNGGEMATKYTNEIDRDGFGGEISIGYNNFWFKGTEVAELLQDYDTSILDLIANPKFLKMYDTFIHMTTASGQSLLFGDGGDVGVGKFIRFPDEALRGYIVTRNPRLAQNFYAYVDGDLENYPLNPFYDLKELLPAIHADVEKYGKLKLESENLAGYGLAIVRGGECVDGKETGYDTWMYYGRTILSHAHRDMLHMGIDAYGFNFAPDLGNPEFKALTANRYEWNKHTLSHNTVTVDDLMQEEVYTGTPLHFDCTDRVKLIDTVCNDAYNQTDIYRRSLITIAVNEDVSYTLDFFRVKGGNKHTYSFHSSSYMGYQTDDLDLQPQVDGCGEYIGTYAGSNVPYGPDPYSTDMVYATNPKYPRGYTWLRNVNRGIDKTDGLFTVDFKQTDFWEKSQYGDKLHMKFHALNDWTADSVDIVTGYPPRRKNNSNIPGLDYMFIQRNGEKLDTLFTSLLEPYKEESYILRTLPVAVTMKEGAEGMDDVVKAVKVGLKNGRTDYVVYATNNAVTYIVTDGDVCFDFMGFVGVYSVDANGNHVYSYLNDGTLIGNLRSIGAYTGTVVDFTKELVMDNYIIMKPHQIIKDMDALKGQYIYIDNKGAKCNGAYKILNAQKQGESIALYLGNASFIEGYADDNNLDAGFVYTIEEGQKFSIPVSMTRYNK